MGKKKQTGHVQYAAPYGAQQMPQQQMYGYPQQMNPQYAPPMYGFPGQHPAPQKQKKKKKGPLLIILLVVALLLIVGGVVLGATQCDNVKASLRDPNQTEGQLDGKTAEEIQAELNRQVEYGMFNISIAAGTEFYDGQSEGELKIENVPGNHYLMQVTIVDNDTGQTIYTSGILDPNHHIQKTKLDVDLDAGVYDCTAFFTALDLDTEEPVGQAAAKISIKVLN